jgi:molybdopterin converting factor small subunit
VVTLLYFASLRESLGRSREQVALPAASATVSSLVEELRR